MKTENHDNGTLDGEISLDNLDAMFNEASAEETTLEEEIIGDLNEEPKPNAEEEEEEVITDPKVNEEEEESEEEEEEVITDPNLEEEEPINSEPSEVLSRANSLIELGIIDDVRIATSEDDKEGTLLSEFTDLNENQLKQIIEKQQEKKDQQIQENFISKEGVSEDNLRIINILKEGGDINEIFSSPQQMQRPFQDLDIDDEKVQKQIILHHFIHNAGHSQKEALVLLKQKEEDFELDTYSKKIVDGYNKKYDEFLDQKEAQVKQQATERKQKISETRKSLSKVLKDSKIKDSISRKIIDGVTKPTSNNRFQIHEVLDKILESPEENHEILLHLLDPKSFQELYKIKQKSKEVNTVFKLIDSLPKDKAKKIEKNKKDDTLTDFEKEIINIDIN